MNLKANELRIGNLVYSITHKVNINVSLIEIDTDYSTIEGIPLTEERLLRLGFENKLGIFYCNEYIFLTINGDVYFGDVNNVDSEKIAKTPYVHQLQNLCFALKGTELKLTDKS